METSGCKIEDILTSDPPLNKEAWHQVKGWYKFLAGRTSLPARPTIERAAKRGWPQTCTNLSPGAMLPCGGGGSEVRMSSILPPDVSTCHSQSAFKLAAIWRLRRRRRPWLHVGSWSMETLVSTSLHMSANIHVLFYAYCALVLGIIHWRSMKSATSFVGVVGGRRGVRVLLQS